MTKKKNNANTISSNLEGLLENKNILIILSLSNLIFTYSNFKLYLIIITSTSFCLPD